MSAEKKAPIAFVHDVRSGPPLGLPTPEPRNPLSPASPEPVLDLPAAVRWFLNGASVPRYPTHFGLQVLYAVAHCRQLRPLFVIRHATMILLLGCCSHAIVFCLGAPCPTAVFVSI